MLCSAMIGVTDNEASLCWWGKICRVDCRRLIELEAADVESVWLLFRQLRMPRYLSHVVTGVSWQADDCAHIAQFRHSNAQPSAHRHRFDWRLARLKDIFVAARQQTTCQAVVGLAWALALISQDCSLKTVACAFVKVAVFCNCRSTDLYCSTKDNLLR